MNDSLGAPQRWRPWIMLAVAAFAQAAVSVFLIAPALLIPVLHDREHLSLTSAGLLASAPNVGMVVALVAWGALVDRFGEKRILIIGLSLTSLVALATALARGLVSLGVLLFVGGLCAASANAASGRVVVGWFPAPRRGLAMGIRQIAQPVGVTFAAGTIPLVARGDGRHWALVVPMVAIAIATVLCAVALVDPPRPEPFAHTEHTARNPYRTSSFLWRIHAVSALLVVPQFTLSIFGLVWLENDRHWSAGAAGALMGASQLIGSAGRILVGLWSDRLGSRVRLLRGVALCAAGVMFVLALCDREGWFLAAGVFVIATTISVADNGLGFTAVAEVAGPAWAGRALGAQNTGQFVAAAAVGPVMGSLIGGVGFAGSFTCAGLVALCAVPFVPRADGHVVTTHDHVPQER